MRLLSRDFSPAEKLLILFLTLVLIALGYYQFVHRPVTSDVEQAHAERDALEQELMAVRSRVGQLNRMRDELERVQQEHIGYMPSYNASRAEIAQLNSILHDAEEYSVSFAGVTRSGDQIRRNFTLQFTARSYNAAKALLTELTEGENRCLLGDLSYSVRGADYVARAPEGGGAASGSGWVDVSVTATFFETMVGGTPDAGLPAEGN